jgi:MOSC domain-containing protein YiiM
VGTQLQIGDAVVEMTETRHPCGQLNTIHPILMEIVMPQKHNPAIYNAGMLGIVIQGGVIRDGDAVRRV